MGAINPRYVTELTQSLNDRVELQEKRVGSGRSDTEQQRKRITIDGKAAVIEEIKIEAGITSPKPPKVTRAFIAGEEYKAPATFNGNGRQIISVGNDWTPELEARLAKSIPKAELKSLRDSMRSGKVIIEIDEIGGNAVSQAIIAQTQQKNTQNTPNQFIKR